MMTGIVRRIDDLGRIVIPKEIRNQLKIRDGDPFEIILEGNDTVCFRKYNPIFDMDSSVVSNIGRILVNEGITFAIYDKDCIRWTNDKIQTFPKDTDVIWLEKKNAFNVRNISVYPIVVSGDIFGYVATIDAKKTDFVRAVVAMASGCLEE